MLEYHHLLLIFNDSSQLFQQWLNQGILIQYSAWVPMMIDSSI
jgi:hypothetical protein